MSYLSRLYSPHIQRLLVAGLLSLPLGWACNSDDSTPDVPVTFGVVITTLDGGKPADAVDLHCDGTLAVEVSISADPADHPFLLLPSHACGTLNRCGYVRLQALSSGGEQLATADTASASGLLKIPTDRLADVAEIRASLIRGMDDQPLLNPDQSAVVGSASPGFVPPTTCPGPGELSGSGGEDGSSVGGGGPDAGGQGPLPQGGAPSDGGTGAVEAGAAGQSPTRPNAGAGGT